MARHILTRDEILAQSQHLQTQEVEVPEWGGTVRLRELTSRERTNVELSLVRQNGNGRNGGAQANFNAYPQLRGRVLARSIIDEDNKALFTEADIESLSELGAGPVERLFTVACNLSGLNQRDVEQIVGNSESTPSEDSLSA